MISPEDFATIPEFAAALRTSRIKARAIAEQRGALIQDGRTVRVDLARFIGKSASGDAAADQPGHDQSGG